VKVAALYDVHGMVRPLDVVIADVERERVDAVVFGGNLLFGPFPRETVGLARSVEDAHVRGNCEREPDDGDRPPLGDDHRRWSRELPLTASIDGVLYCHAAPTNDMPLTTAATPDDVVAALFAGIDEDTVVIGHTHHQLDRRVGALRVINAGSLGMPYEDEVTACWALLVDGVPSFSFRRTGFDVDRAVAEIRASGWPLADEFVAENLLTPVSRADAIAQLERRRAA